VANCDDGFWVFGYGSLVWQPGFTYADRQIARMAGYARSFCMWSIHHRGTEAEPGLVLALDQCDGAFCDGVAFFVPSQTAAETLAYLRERELISSAYLEEVHPILFRDGRSVMSYAYVVDRDHVQYCGGLPLERQAEVISQAVGGRGPNSEYLFNTAQHLTQIGLSDPDLDWLAERVKKLSQRAE
jgi:cation transport protein ChaC